MPRDANGSPIAGPGSYPEGIAGVPVDATAVYVALASETEGLTTALRIRHSMGRWDDASIVVVVEDDNAGVANAVKSGGPAMKGMDAFGWLSRALRPAPLLENTTTELIAHAGHELHCEDQRGKGLTEKEDPSLVPWERLPAILRESNRLWADGIAAKLGALRCVVVPAPLVDPARTTFRFTEEEIAKLAPFEHERWSVDMKRMGFRPGPRDARHHPLIDVPYPDDLPGQPGKGPRPRADDPRSAPARAGFRVKRADDRSSGPRPPADGNTTPSALAIPHGAGAGLSRAGPAPRREGKGPGRARAS